MTAPTYSVVIPCYRSAEILPALFARLAAQFDSMDATWELICVDDNSPDDTAAVIRTAHTRDPRIKLVRHSTNHGQHQALLTGFRYATGELIVTMDDDLQHPPEQIPQLVDALGDNDVVIAAPALRNHAAYKNLGSALMGWTLRAVFKPPPGYVASAFRLLRAPIAKELANRQTAFPYVSGMILRTTSKVTNVFVRHDARALGTSNYTLPKLLRLASNLIINYTKLPLQLMVAIGVGISIISFGFMLHIGYASLFVRDYQPGWPSLVMIMSFFGGLNLLALAMIGEYLSRLLDEVSASRRVVIREALLGDGAPDTAADELRDGQVSR